MQTSQELKTVFEGISIGKETIRATVTMLPKSKYGTTIKVEIPTLDGKGLSPHHLKSLIDVLNEALYFLEKESKVVVV